VINVRNKDQTDALYFLHSFQISVLYKFRIE